MKLAPLDEMSPAIAEAAPQRDVENAELGESIAAAIGELPETPRLVFLLRTGEDMAFAEIAAMLEVTEETARWHMMQARRQLMAKLDGKL